jgi:glycosyltransferase involved in cell wall biosynthesis
VRRTEGGPKLLSFGHAANKNVEPLLKYLSRTPGAALTVICTSPEWDKFWGETAKSLGVSQRVNRLDSLTDAELAAQYENCDVFCMLSTYEGYGLPVAEALSLGRPTVISQNETLMETSRGYALQVDPEDDESLDETIRKAMSIQTDYWQNAKSSFTGPSWEEWIAEILKCLDALEPLEHSYGNGQ